MITWIGSSEDRIISWRKYRQQLSIMTLEEAVTSVNKIWAHCPCLSKLSIDASNFFQWPGPWELINETAFCPLTQILGAFYTLAMTEHNTHSLAIEILSNSIGSKYQINIDNGQQIILLRGKKSVNTTTDTSIVVQRYFWDTKKFYQ